jgi:ribosomal protein L34E
VAQVKTLQCRHMEIAERTQRPNVHLCIFCRQQTSGHQLELNQNTGMLLMRNERTYKGVMCRSCAKKTFTKVQLHNLFLGWWGTISFIMTPIFLLANTGRYIKFALSVNKG